MKIKVSHLVLMWVITHLILYIIASIFYYTGREDITKEIARILELLYIFVYIPAVLLLVSIAIIAMIRTYEEIKI